VTDLDHSDAALMLLGHGSTQNDDSCVPVFQHAAELRRRKLFAEVREAFWKQPPQVEQVLAKIVAPRVFIVPIFISEGYFSEEVIPRELGFDLTDEPASRVTQHTSRITHYCKPIGTHASMTFVLLARADEVVTRHPFPRTPKLGDTTLIIAGHGTERCENSRKAIEQQAELIRALDLYDGVHAVFMEETPRIGDCYALAQTRNLVVVPFFISDGLHCTEDIPVLLGEPQRLVGQRLRAGQAAWRNPTERHGKLVWYAKAVGTEPHVAEVILERVREMAAAVEPLKCEA
jgi:sirohydrochlorin cobaltochelatase